MAARWTVKRVFLWAFVGLLGLMAVAAFAFRDDILFANLDPKIPYPTYRPPEPPNYGRANAWALLPPDLERPAPNGPPADVFFVHPTTYDGGRHWNAPLRQRTAMRFLERVALPNYAGPFARVGRVFAPRYRQANLYAHTTLRDDARDARAFAYEDVRDAFRYWREHYDRGRPLIIAGAEQGGFLVERLLREEVAPDPGLRGRLVAAYLIDTVVPRDRYLPDAAFPACSRPHQAGCVVAWAEEPELSPDPRRLARARIWEGTRLAPLGRREALCVNPVLGAETEVVAPTRQNRGAANATGLEWGVRPAFLPRQVSVRCADGLLRVSNPRSASLRRAGSWSDRKKVKPFNLFYADIEADAEARAAALARVATPEG